MNCFCNSLKNKNCYFCLGTGNILTFTGRGKYLSSYTNTMSKNTLLDDFIKDRDSFYKADCKKFESLKAEIIENSELVRKPSIYHFSNVDNMILESTGERINTIDFAIGTFFSYILDEVALGYSMQVFRNNCSVTFKINDEPLNAKGLNFQNFLKWDKGFSELKLDSIYDFFVYTNAVFIQNKNRFL